MDKINTSFSSIIFMQSFWIRKQSPVEEVLSGEKAETWLFLPSIN